MAANTAPIFVKVVKSDFVQSGTAANTAYDGTGTVATVMTANAVDGSFVKRLIIKPLGTNVLTVMRIFLNNGATNATAANNALIKEITLPATTASQIAALPDYELPLNLMLEAGHKINITIGTAVAAGFSVTAEGGDYA